MGVVLRSVVRFFVGYTLGRLAIMGVLLVIGLILVGNQEAARVKHLPAQVAIEHQHQEEQSASATPKNNGRPAMRKRAAGMPLGSGGG